MSATPAPIVLVHWVDSGAQLDNGWATPEGFAEAADTNDMVVESVGYLIHRDEQHIILAQSYDAAFDHYLNACQIWVDAIIDEEKL